MTNKGLEGSEVKFGCRSFKKYICISVVGDTATICQIFFQWTRYTAHNSPNGHLREGGKEMFYLTTHSTHFIYGYMASDIWLRTIPIDRKETHCRHIGYSFRLTARVLLYAPSHRQDITYHGLCYTSRGALTGTRDSHLRESVPLLLLRLTWSYTSPCHIHTDRHSDKQTDR